MSKTPVVGPLLRALKRRLAALHRFRGSARYWEQRYASEGTSGAGSYGEFARFKAGVLNAFVAEHQVQSVMEFGCGDGNQLRLAEYPTYRGFDVSLTAVERCREIFSSDPSKSFALLSDYQGEQAELVLSLDVIYHLVEDEVFEAHLRTLFAAALRHVIVFSSDVDKPDFGNDHVRYRRFTPWVETHAPEWSLIERIENPIPYANDVETGTRAHFFVYGRR
ncbi:MAG: class I SAM-dependent methyltransferase [Deltaproteobacteria bacterium]|nr:class I SAM-dependent methyltransferase [Deltaproteobacteria bacterium]